MALRALLRLFAASALLALFAVPEPVAAAALVRLAIGRPVVTADSLVYPIRVIAPGAAAVAILPPQTRLATLEIDGVEVQRVGSYEEVVGHRPLAHGSASFVLADLRPGQRIELRVTGTRQPPSIYALDVVATTYGTGVVTGMLYGLLATAVLVQIVAIFGYREWANLWYLGSLLDLTLVELIRNGVWVDPQKLTPVLGVCEIGLAVLMTGFAASYLDLYRRARGLFWTIVAANTLPGIALILAGTVVGLSNIGAWQFMPPLLGNGALIAAAALRRRMGFKPASLLFLGLCSMGMYFATSIAIDTTNSTVPFFDSWGFEIAVASDVLLFSLGIAYRDRLFKRAQSEVEHELRVATFAAHHDPLTGLLNRRGLEAWLAATPYVAGTLLYLDLDGFKAVNDRGGHAAGDDTLRLVARIIARAVREEDRTARLGGDEFAIVLVNVRSRETVERVSSRISDAIGSLRPLGAQVDLRIGVSTGIGRIANAGAFEDALREADGALYRQKSEHHAFARMRTVN